MSNIRLKSISIEPNNYLDILSGNGIVIENSLNSIGSSASLILNGGISIKSVQNSTGLSAGGGLTNFGGFTTLKDSYFGDSVYIENSIGTFNVKGTSTPRFFIDTITNKNITFAPNGIDTIFSLNETFLQINYSQNSSNSSTGAVYLLGGMSINSNTDSTNISSGGALTVAGGASFAKKVFMNELNVLQATIGNATIGNVFSVGVSTIYGSIGSLTVGNVSGTNIESINSSFGSVSFGNIFGIGVASLSGSIGNLTVGNISGLNSSFGSVSFGNIFGIGVESLSGSIGNLTVGNISGLNASFGSVSFGNIFGIGVASISGSIGNLTVGNISGLNASFGSVSFGSLSGNNVESLIGSIGNLTVGNISGLNASFGSVSFGSLSGVGVASLSGSIGNLTVGNISGLNSSFGSVSFGSLLGNNVASLSGSIGNLTVGNFSGLNSSFGSVSFGSLSGVGVASLSGSIGNLTVGNISGLNSSFGSVSFGNMSGLGIASLSGSIGNLTVGNISGLNSSFGSVSFGNMSGVGVASLSGSIGNLTVGNISGLNSSFGSVSFGSLSGNNISSLSGFISNITVGNIYSTSGIPSYITEGSITFAGGLTILDSTNATDLTMGSRALSVVGGAVVNKDLYVGGNAFFKSTTGSTNVSIAGETEIAGNLNILKNTIIHGDLIVNGTTSNLNSINTVIEDNIISLNSGPSGTKDSGFLINRFQTENDNRFSPGNDVVNDSAVVSGDILSSSGGNFINLQLTGGNLIYTNDYYKNWWIAIITGGGANQVRKITAFTGSNSLISVNTPFNIIPSATHTFELYNKSFVGLVYDETNDYFYLGSTVDDPSNGSIGSLNFTDVMPLKLGKMIIQDTTTSINSSSGGLLLLGGGGMSINSTTNSTNISSGGAFTVAGGGAFAKKVFMNELNVNGKEMTPGLYDIPTTTSATFGSNTYGNINGLFFDDSIVWSHTTFLSVRINASANLYEYFELKGLYNPNTTSWDFVSNKMGDNSLMVFNMTPAGNVVFTSGNYTGFSSGSVKFKSISL